MVPPQLFLSLAGPFQCKRSPYRALRSLHQYRSSDASVDSCKSVPFCLVSHLEGPAGGPITGPGSGPDPEAGAGTGADSPLILDNVGQGADNAGALSSGKLLASLDRVEGVLLRVLASVEFNKRRPTTSHYD